MSSLFDASAEQELKQWLIDHLRDKCPADPTLLADYVLALLRDTDKETIGGTLKDQLNEFLGDHVNSFVSEFMSALDRGLFKEKPKSTAPPSTTSTSSSVAASSSSSSTQQNDLTKRKRKDETVDQEYSRDTKKTKPTPNNNKQQDRQTKGFEKSKSKDDYDNERRDTRDKRKDSKYDRDNKYDRDSKYNDRDSKYDKNDNRKDSKYDRDSKYDKNDKRKENKRIEGEIIKDSYGNNILVLNKDILSDPTAARLPSTNTIMLTNSTRVKSFA